MKRCRGRARGIGHVGCVLPFPTSPPTKLWQRTSQGRGKAAEQTMCPGAEDSGDRRVTCPSKGKFGRWPPRAFPQDRQWAEKGERMGKRRKQSEVERSSQKHIKES